MPGRRYLAIPTLAIATVILYLFQLSGIGILGPDEPRYAAIGRSMATTGDFITPRLWGSPWFEKPPLLYWMTALGSATGLGPEMCGRLPVALMSLCFLGWSAWALTREYPLRVAVAASAMLATSAGWLAFSSLCLTDLPLAVCFSAAVFVALPLLRPEPDSSAARARFLWIGILIGLAILAKGLVPIALAVPFAWFLRRHWKQWWIAIASALIISLPWYWLVYARNGFPFIQDFFLKHHFERLYSSALLHVQPWYYYVPVLFGVLFPWSPLLILLRLRPGSMDQRFRFLLAIVLFGLVFFSLARNKLPGYLLPLAPACMLLIAISAFEHRRVCEFHKRWLVAPAILIASVPVFAPMLPQTLAMGKFSAPSFANVNPTTAFYVLLPLAVLVLAPRVYAPSLLVLTAVAAALFLKGTEYAAIDAQVSARALWRKTEAIAGVTCDGGTNRDWIFGLSFYRGSVYPPCGDGKSFRYAFHTRHRGVPDLEPLHP